jgi:hypothetical protein
MVAYRLQEIDVDRVDGHAPDLRKVEEYSTDPAHAVLLA